MILSKGIKKLIYFLALVAMLAIVIFNIIYINQIDIGEFSHIEYYGILKLVTSIVIAIMIILISYGLEKIKTGKKFKIGIVTICLLMYVGVQAFWISESISKPYADSEQLMLIAKEIIDGNGLSEYNANYIQYHTQQLTQVSVMVFLFKIFNTTNYLLFEYLNMICNVLTILGLYAITRMIYKEEKCNRVLFWILTLTFIPIIMLVTFVYGDFLGLPFCIWAIYFAMRFERTAKLRNAIITTIFLSIACLLRMNYFIFAIAIGIYWFIYMLDKKTKKDVIIGILSIMILISMIIIPSNIIKNAYDKEFNLSKEKSFSVIPYLYMGISEGDLAYGWYNDESGDNVYHLMNDNKEEVEELSNRIEEDFKERVKYLLQNPMYTIKFYAKKIITTWTEPSYEYSFYNQKNIGDENIDNYFIADHLVNGKVFELIKIYQKAIIYIVFIGSIITIIINRKKINKEILLLILVFLGGFGFHILWETKSRYIIPYVIILIPVSLGGIEFLVSKIKNKCITKEDIKLLKEKNTKQKN